MRGKRNYQGKYFQKMSKPFGEDYILEESMLNVVSFNELWGVSSLTSN